MRGIVESRAVGLGARCTSGLRPSGYNCLKSQPRTQDARANRTRHTTSSSTQPHAKQQPANAPQTNLTFTRTHTSRTENDAHQQTTPPRIIATLTQPLPRASALASETIACAISPPTSPPAPPPAASPAAAPAAQLFLVFSPKSNARTSRNYGCVAERALKRTTKPPEFPNRVKSLIRKLSRRRHNSLRHNSSPRIWLGRAALGLAR